MMSKYVKYCMLLYDSLVYTVRYARILVYSYGLLFIYTNIHMHILKDQKYSICNCNELRTEITSLIEWFVSLWYCDIPLNLKTIIHREVKLLSITCSAFGLWFYIVKKSMVLHINNFVNFAIKILCTNALKRILLLYIH